MVREEKESRNKEDAVREELEVRSKELGAEESA